MLLRELGVGLQRNLKKKYVTIFLRHSNFEQRSLYFSSPVHLIKLKDLALSHLENLVLSLFFLAMFSSVCLCFNQSTINMLYSMHVQCAKKQKLVAGLVTEACALYSVYSCRELIKVMTLVFENKPIRATPFKDRRTTVWWCHWETEFVVSLSTNAFTLPCTFPNNQSSNQQSSCTEFFCVCLNLLKHELMWPKVTHH